MITPDEAYAELARRELARRELAKRSSSDKQVIEGSAQHGGISKTPSLMERIGRNLTQKETRPLGLTGGLGFAMSAAGMPEEDVFPMAGQALGGETGGFLGATGGAMVGQGARQLVKNARGENGSLAEVGKEGLITGAIEGATRGVGNFVFRRQIANDALKSLGGKLGEMKKALASNPSLSIPSEQIYMPLKQAVEGVAVPHGPQSSIINKWLKFMEGNPELSASHLMELEGDLGEAASYGQMKKGALVQPSNIKKPALNSIAKDSRRQVSGIVDDMAEGAGQSGFGKTSKKVAKLLKNPEKTNVTKTSGNLFTRLAAGGAIGGLAHNPAMGGLAYLGLEALHSPQARNLAYKLGKTGPAKMAGKGAKLTMAEVARRMLGSKKS